MQPFHIILAIGMLITGSLNTLTTKWADDTRAAGLGNLTLPWGNTTLPPKFEHPFVQSLGMFCGELSCMIAFYIVALKRRQPGEPIQKLQCSPMLFFIPALCDMTATSLMYVGLNMTYASVFQMLRGSVVIFTGILSVLFLKRKLYPFHWLGMLLVLLGLGCVGVSSILNSTGDKKDQQKVLLGDILILSAQIVVAIQMVVEERFVGKFNVPALLAVGWEGLFGVLIALVCLILFYFIPGESYGNRMENALDAVEQMKNNPRIGAFLFGNMISIAFFNFFGISVTKEMSATTRMVLDSLRTFIIWIVGLSTGEKFHWLQVVGFAFLLSGTAVYNKLLVIPIPMCKPPPETENTERLLNDDPFESNGFEDAPEASSALN